jgi:hypothetical protein
MKALPVPLWNALPRLRKTPPRMRRDRSFAKSSESEETTRNILASVIVNVCPILSAK